MEQTILTEKQQLLLTLLSQKQDITQHFYLSGGTALAEYYLKHRYSEDLDFFSFDEFDPMVIQIVLKTVQKQATIKTIDYQQSFNRNLFFLHLENDVIKTEFTYYPFMQLEKPRVIDSIRVDSLMDIAVNKVFTMYQNPRSRDFIDLYLIIKERKWSFDELKKKARIKFDTHIDPLQLAQQLLKAKTVKDYPRMLVSLKNDEWIDFFISQAANLKKDVLQ